MDLLQNWYMGPVVLAYQQFKVSKTSIFSKNMTLHIRKCQSVDKVHKYDSTKEM